MKIILRALNCAALVLAVINAPSFAAESAVTTDNKAHLMTVPTTYCNPMNLDYAYALRTTIQDSHPHRSTADPACVMYKGKYWLFSTNQEGYWWSDDMRSWNFIPHKFKYNGVRDQVCAPGLWPTDRGLLFVPSFADKDQMPIYRSTDPLSGEWEEVTDALAVPTWDPSFFQDDDKRLYLYWGSSNVFPLKGVELDPTNGYKPKGQIAELLKLDPKHHGWEQFGEDNQNGTVDPYVEGAWVNKFAGKYYLQYGAPGTEWNVYGDGVYVSDKPLGPFVYQQHNPFSWKPTGFINGAGHGCTFEDKVGNVWHMSTMVVGIKHKFERRLGLFPAGVDKDGVLFADTEFGDYPHTFPSAKQDPHSEFANWMLLSYKKNCSSSTNEKNASLAFDENIKTFWTSGRNQPGDYISVNLSSPMDVRAIQVNFADDNNDLFEKASNISQKYKIFDSLDGKNWNLLIDKSENTQDVPHDYCELSSACRTRFIKVENVSAANGNFAIGDLRIFGNATGSKPAMKGDDWHLTATPDSKDQRVVGLKWNAAEDAYAYEVCFGNSPDKLYSSFIVYDKADYTLHALNVDTPYFFQVKALNEVGVSEPSKTVELTRK